MLNPSLRIPHMLRYIRMRERGRPGTEGDRRARARGTSWHVTDARSRVGGRSFNVYDGAPGWTAFDVGS